MNVEIFGPKCAKYDPFDKMVERL